MALNRFFISRIRSSVQAYAQAADTIIGFELGPQWEQNSTLKEIGSCESSVYFLQCTEELRALSNGLNGTL